MTQRVWISMMVTFMLGLSGNAGFSAPPRFTPATQLHHIHGLAVDPHDPSILYIATHGGLVRLAAGENWEHVGEGRSDLMGFTHHPSQQGAMYVSGHPDSSHLPNPIGVMVSNDGGQSWQPLALAGKVDLHAMTIAADGNTLYGWNVSGAPGLYRISVRDGDWSRVDSKGLQDVFSLAAHPQQSNTLLAGTRQGVLRTRDGGKTWSPVTSMFAGITVTAVAYHPRDPRVLYAYAVRPDFGLVTSENEGESWMTLGFFLGEKDAVNVFAISPHQRQTIYISTFGSDLYRSQDAGIRWEPLAKQGRPVKP